MKDIIIKEPTKELTYLLSLKEWRQRIKITDDLYTPGSRCEYEWDMCFLPQDLHGKSFLDVGANDGMFSFLAERKGASQVTSVDLYIDKAETQFEMTNGWYKGRILGIKELLKSSIEVQSCSIYNLHSLDKTFDVVFCGNVLAWLENQTEALKQLAGVTKKTLILRDDVSRVKGKPVMEYVNNETLTDCMFNANRAFYEKYLRSLGFKSITFQLVDEFSIFEKRSEDFPKHQIPMDVEVFESPFAETTSKRTSQKHVKPGTILINGRYFFNEVGWIRARDVTKLTAAAIPKNFLKRWNYKRAYQRNAKDNYMIVAEK